MAALAFGSGRRWIGAAQAGERSLGGRPFGDPALVLPMPAEWRQRPIIRPPNVDLALAIDQQMSPALHPLVGEFAAANKLRIASQEGTCGIASNALVARSADITGMCCPPGALDRLPGVRYHTVGIAAIALIVHPSNALSDIDLAGARRLFNGDARTWSDLPVSGLSRIPGRVQAVTRLHCATRPGHWRLLLDNADLFRTDTVEVPAIIDMLIEVGRNPQAIGYETLWHIADKARQGKVKALRLNGRAAEDAEALAAGLYPLYRVFNLSTWSESPAAETAAQRLVRHLIDNAHRIHPQFGIVPASRLRAAGWQFVDDEVIAEPG